MDFLTKLAASFNLSPAILFGALFVGVILFLFALREFLSWYLRVYQVQEEVKALRLEMMALKKEITKIKTQPSKTKPPRIPKAPQEKAQTPKENEPTRQDRFTLSH